MMVVSDVEFAPTLTRSVTINYMVNVAVFYSFPHQNTQISPDVVSEAPGYREKMVVPSRHEKSYLIESLSLLLLFGGCAQSLSTKEFAHTTPVFDPITFWTGSTASWGVMENRSGAPVSIVTTRTEGTMQTDAHGKEFLKMVQQVMVDGKTTPRTWQMRRLGNGVFEATANDMVGTARGTASGRTFHWTWTLATKPGNALKNVRMKQWMYLADNGTMMNRTIITKFGVRLAEVSEQFVRQEEVAPPK